jgi:hypothetical protein
MRHFLFGKTKIEGKSLPAYILRPDAVDGVGEV